MGDGAAPEALRHGPPGGGDRVQRLLVGVRLLHARMARGLARDGLRGGLVQLPGHGVAGVREAAACGAVAEHAAAHLCGGQDTPKVQEGREPSGQP